MAPEKPGSNWESEYELEPPRLPIVRGIPTLTGVFTKEGIANFIQKNLQGKPKGTAIKIKGVSETYGYIQQALEKYAIEANVSYETHIRKQKNPTGKHPRMVEHTFMITVLGP